MKLAVVLVTAMTACVTSTASAAYIYNGTFEATGSTTVFSAWTQGSWTPGVLNNGIHGTKSLLLAQSSGNGTLSQTTNDQPQAVTLDMDLAVSDKTTSGTSRTFNIYLRFNNGSQINLRVISDVEGKDKIQVFDGAGNNWIDLLTASVSVSSSQTDLQVNHLKFVLNPANGSYDLIVTDASNNEYQALNITYFQQWGSTGPSKPLVDGWLSSINFPTTNMAPDSWAVVDNIVIAPVPEPASISLLALSIGGLLLGRRVRHH